MIRLHLLCRLYDLLIYAHSLHRVHSHPMPFLQSCHTFRVLLPVVSPNQSLLHLSISITRKITWVYLDLCFELFLKLFTTLWASEHFMNPNSEFTHSFHSLVFMVPSRIKFSIRVMRLSISAIAWYRSFVVSSNAQMSHDSPSGSLCSSVRQSLIVNLLS